MEFYSDSMGFNGIEWDLMEFYSDSMGFNGIEWDFDSDSMGY